MGGTLGAQILTIVSLLFIIAYYEPPFLTFMAILKVNPGMGEIVSIWFVVLSLWAMVKITMMIGQSANRFLSQVLAYWTRKSPESS
jgi:hypothetical protein